MISISSDISVVVIAHEVITVMVVFTVTLFVVISSSSETITAGVVTLSEIYWSVTGFPFDHS